MRSNVITTSSQSRTGVVLKALLVLALTLAVAGHAGALEVSVVDPDGNPVSGFRWLLQEDTTLWVEPGVPVSDSIGVNIHNSYAPPAGKGQTAESSATVTVPDPAKRYFVSILPDSAATSSGHALGGAPVAPGQAAVTVVVNAQPIPTAQISVFVFEDHNIINNAPDLGIETGLGNFKIIIEDAGGQAIQDAWGNPLGTSYLKDGSGLFILDPDGVPTPDVIGSGVILSDPDGWANIKYIVPGKYAVIATPPPGAMWVQTATIEGTNVIDAWVKADEPELFVEGFGASTAHVSVGFVNPDILPWAVTPPGGAGTITGRLVNNHFARPPFIQGFHSGEPIPDCWVGLNNVASQSGLIAVECNPDSTFTISGVPEGTYQFVHWDLNLDQLFGFSTVVVPPGGGLVDLGDVLSNRWFGTLQGQVFLDVDEDGFPDAGETGLGGQEVLLRFRDGRIYKAANTDAGGEYILSEVFPFFKWLVVEVGFLSRKATGATMAVDGGGAVPTDDGWITPSRGKLNPQEQAATNPHTNNNLSRTEVGEVLTQAMMLFLGQTNVIDFGKNGYKPGENGGISGVTYHAITRAENNPRFAAAEEWEPGIPRVQMVLYADFDADGIIDDLDTNVGPTAADVDNFPFGFFDGEAPGAEDVDWNSNNAFDPGDALNVGWTDSWDDSKPEGCIQELPIIHGQPVPECYDNFGTWNQIRDGIFDGGWAFTSYFPGGMASGSPETDGLPTGTYIVEAAAPPFFRHLEWGDKNVDWGENYTPSYRSSLGTRDNPDPTEAIAVPCVGDPYTPPTYLALFPDEMIETAYPGLTDPLRCDRKQVALNDGFNAAAEFPMFTEVPIAAQVVGFVNNDLRAEFNNVTPNFGEKAAPRWLPISVQDYYGNEISRIYTDEFGAYNGLIPSTYTMNVAAPSGVSPNMVTYCLNHPFLPATAGRQPTLDPFYDPNYSQACWTLQFTPGGATYLDTPIVPLGAFVGAPGDPIVDVEPWDGVPSIYNVDGDVAPGGPLACAPDALITVYSVGPKSVPNPNYDPDDPLSEPTVIRDYGFSGTQGRLTLGGTDLPIVSWTDGSIQATVPGGSATGTLLVQRGDNSEWSESGVTLHVGECSAHFVPSGMGTIQAAIDAAAPGDLIVVAPGVYEEAPIVYKPLRLQGAGAESTTVFAAGFPSEKIQAWHDKVISILGNDPFGAQEMPGFMVFGDAGFPFGTGGALIDGFTVTGSLAGGGIYVYRDAHNLVISNNTVRSSQGTFGGGVTIGSPEVDGLLNLNITVDGNRIVKNGGIRGGGGVSIYAGATDYSVTNNQIIGNLSRYYGAGINHFGFSDGGFIGGNEVLFNEVFFGGQIGGDGGGLYLAGSFDPADPADLSQGTGSVVVDGNRFQGNMAGSGNGGGIALARANGDDLLLPANQWHTIEIVNNIVANNVAAVSGAGIYLQDVANAFIINNTIVNNDSTATGAEAFPPGNMSDSNPQVAGVASNLHSAVFAAAFPAGLEQEYSDPALANNIIQNNRSFVWDASLNAQKGGLKPGPETYTDLGVNSTDPTHVLHPMHSVLTDDTGYDPSNETGDPFFQASYANSLVTAAVQDEGGNAISVLFTPLTAAPQDYLLITTGAGRSSAFGTADASWISLIPELGKDFEGDNRWVRLWEAGADEFPYPPGDVNCSGTLENGDVLQVLGVTFGGPTACSSEDQNRDGAVDAADIAVVINDVAN